MIHALSVKIDYEDFIIHDIIMHVKDMIIFIIILIVDTYLNIFIDIDYACDRKGIICKQFIQITY